MELLAQGLQEPRKSTKDAMPAVYSSPFMSISAENDLGRASNSGGSSLYMGLTSSLWLVRNN